MTDAPAEGASPPGALAGVADDHRVRRVVNGATGVLAFYFVQQWLWPAPLGVLVQGMVIGGLTALIAFGIALVYRANRVVNFAQGDLGAAPAALAVLLIVGWGWPYPIAMLAGLAAAIVLGAVVELLVVRRFFRAPRLILTVATIGLAQILAGIGVVLPQAFDLKIPPQSYPSPFDFSFEVSPIVFRGNDIVAMLAIPAAIVALVFFTRYTSIGTAMRAAAERPEQAALLGVPVKRIHTIVWVIATVLATVAMLLRAGIVGLPIGTVLGPSVLLRGLAAAVIGRMERLPTIFVAAVALGIVEQAVVWETGRALLVDPILFLVVMGALLVQRRREVARTDTEEESWQAVQEARPIPPELVALPEVRWGRRGAALLAVLLVVAVPAVFDESRTNLAAAVLIFAIVALSLTVLTGWAGQVSLGQAAFLGIGGAVAGAATSQWGWELSASLLLAGVAGGAVAMVIGVPALRIRGLFLTVSTLAFALATSSYVLNPEFVHWLPDGRVTRPLLFGRVSLESETRFYYFCAAALGLAYLGVLGLRRSRGGRVIIAVRENERALQAFGVNATRAKLVAFAFSGFLAAIAGALFVHHQQALGVAAYLPERSLRAFTTVVIGGLGSAPGAILGAVYVQSTDWFRTLLPEPLRPLLTFLGTGAGLLIVLMVLPGGLGSILYAVRDRLLRLAASRRGIVVPSLVADVREAADARAPAPSVLDTASAVEDAIAAAPLASAAPPARAGGT